MKKIIFMLIALTLMSSTSWSQQLEASKIPAAVRSAFKVKFPTAVKPAWEQENADEFEANFKLNGKKVSANFDQAGKWLKTETNISVSALPAAVQASLKKDFANFTIHEARKIQSAKNGNCFEAEIEGKESWNVLFTANGKLISKALSKEEEEEEGDDD